jgi:hypothetical protein
MKRLLSVALGILTAIGGFVDIGDIVANSESGARFGMSLAWVVVVGVTGICLFAEMAGRWSGSAWARARPCSTCSPRSSSRS